MKHLALILVLLAAAFSVQAEDVPGMAAFLQEVTAACGRRDVARLQGLEYETGAAPEMQQANSARWAYIFSGSYPEAGWHFDTVTFTPLESLAAPVSESQITTAASTEAKQAAKRANDARKEVLESVTKPLSVKGKLYEHNLKVIGFACIMFAKERLQSGVMFPVGVDPEGRVRFALLQPAAEDVPGMAAFLKEVTAACERRDAARLQSLQYEAGVTSARLKADNERWLTFFERENGEDRSFDTVTFTSLRKTPVLEMPRKSTSSEDGMSVTQVSQTMRDFLMERSTEPQKIDSRFYEYNLKVVGFISIFFRVNHQQVAEMFPVGVDPEGRVRFALLRPVEKEASPHP